MHRRKSCERVMSCSVQIASTFSSIDVGSRNAINRSGRSPLSNFNPYPHPSALLATQKSYPNLDRAAAAHIVPIAAGSAGDHLCHDTAKRNIALDHICSQLI